MAAVLITGRTGIGKTTLVRRVLDALDAPAGGPQAAAGSGSVGRLTEIHRQWEPAGPSG